MNKTIGNTTTAKQIYFWNLLGNIWAAAISVLLLMLTSRLLPANLADEFSVAYSLGHLWVVIGLFQVRNYQATDVQFTHSFESYLQARFITVLAMILSIIPYLFLTTHQQALDNYVFIFLMVVYRMWDAVSDVFQGLCQQHERLDIAGKSMVFRYSTTVLIWLVTLILTHSLTLSIASLAIWNGICVYIFDYLPSRAILLIQWRKLFSGAVIREALAILKACVALFINGFILVYIFNEPKIVIELGLKQGWLQEGMQRDYNILFMPVFFMSLCILVLRPLITKMAQYWSSQQTCLFYQTLRQIILALCLGGIVVTALAYVIGIPILSLIFGVQLAGYEKVLALLVLSGIFYAIAIVLENVLTILRKQKYMLFVYIVLLIQSKILTYPLIQHYQLLGASIGFLLNMVVFVSGMSLLAVIFIRRTHDRKN